MILIKTLEDIAIKKLTDSKILFKANKFDTSIYLVGYSIELALKSKICKILKLDNGFPETKVEFQEYILSKNDVLRNEIKHFKKIKNHKLEELLFYSGKEFIVKEQLFNEWNNVLFWKPELRYKLNFGNKELNKKIINSVEKLITLILK